MHGVRCAQETELRTLLRRYVPSYNGARYPGLRAAQPGR